MKLADERIAIAILQALRSSPYNTSGAKIIDEDCERTYPNLMLGATIATGVPLHKDGFSSEYLVTLEAQSMGEWEDAAILADIITQTLTPDNGSKAISLSPDFDVWDVELDNTTRLAENAIGRHSAEGKLRRYIIQIRLKISQ